MMTRDAHVVSANRLTKNFGFNIAGQLIPFAAAAVTIPYVIRHLGTARFGLLSFSWVLLGYFGMFDLGLSRATTKFVAECLATRDEDRLARIVDTSVLSQVAFGVIGGIVMAALTPLLVRLWHVPPALQLETKESLFVLAVSLPVVLLANALRGVLEAAQRFDLTNYVRMPASVSTFVLPAVGVAFGAQLTGIIVLLALSRVVTAIVFGFLCRRALHLESAVRVSWDALGEMMRYGGWVTVSNFIGPLLAYVERFFIGAMLSVTMLGYYSAPYDLVTRFLVVPWSLLSVLFPAFAGLSAIGQHEKYAEIYARSVNYLLLVAGPCMVLVAFVAHPLLVLWLGPEYAAQASVVLKVLAPGVFFNSIAAAPLGLLQAIGRADLPAKFHLIEAPIYAGALWLLIPRFGIAGAAYAWTGRVLLDAVLLFAGSMYAGRVGTRAMKQAGVTRSCAVLAALWIVVVPLTRWTQDSLRASAIGVVALAATMAALVWLLLLAGDERAFVVAAARNLLERARGGKPPVDAGAQFASARVGDK